MKITVHPAVVVPTPRKTYDLIGISEGDMCIIFRAVRDRGTQRSLEVLEQLRQTGLTGNEDTGNEDTY